MNEQELIKKSQDLFDLAKLKLIGDVPEFIQRQDVQVAFAMMCANAGWDISSRAMMETLLKAASFLVAIHLADRQQKLTLEDWPLAPE